MNPEESKATVEERRLRLEERRLALEQSFARKWLPALATVMVGLVATTFGYVQQRLAAEGTERTRIEATARDQREWGFKVVEMYFNKRELFDLTKNTDQATANLRVLAAVAPKAVQGLLNAEQSRIPPPSGGAEDSQRLQSLSAVAVIQSALSEAKSHEGPDAKAEKKAEEAMAEASLKPSDFMAYIQYPESSRDIALKAQAKLQALGFRAPGIEQVGSAPSRLQVRYYRREQREFAARLALDLGADLHLPATADNAILVTSPKQLPTGILEVWLPPASNQER